jgi:NTP pyrophosphatase (non-canonical NTP hydrolase)
MGDMTINEFADLNERRCYSPEAKAKWGDTSLRDLADWVLCIAGEAGEVCNAVKKYQVYTTTDPAEFLRKRLEIVDEIADVMTYCVLALRYLKVGDVELALMHKFNEVSDRIGWKEEVGPDLVRV